jgi:hypothetical protein
VPVVVPRQRRHAIAWFDAEPFQRAGKAVDARHHVAVRRAVNAVVALGHNLFALMQSFDPPQDVLKSELVVLHQAFHGRHLHLSFAGTKVMTARW